MKNVSFRSLFLILLLAPVVLAGRPVRADNDLDPGARPQPGEQTVEVRARTSFGDITVHRAVTTAPATASR